MFKNGRSKPTKSIAAFYKSLAVKTLLGGISLKADETDGYSDCFYGSLYTMAASTIQDLDHRTQKKFFNAGKTLTAKCYKAYTTKLNSKKVTCNYELSKVMENCFYMWRYYHQDMYREMGWKLFKAVNNKEGRSVNSKSSNRGSQQNWYFTNVAKYAFLLFSDDDVIPSTKYVFNAGAHPIPVLTK